MAKLFVCLCVAFTVTIFVGAPTHSLFLGLMVGAVAGVAAAGRMR